MNFCTFFGHRYKLLRDFRPRATGDYALICTRCRHEPMS